MPAKPTTSDNAKLNRANKLMVNRLMRIIKLKHTNRTAAAPRFLPSVIRLQRDTHRANTRSNLAWFMVSRMDRCPLGIPTTPTRPMDSKVKFINSVSTSAMRLCERLADE
jgi:hypothetical protein